MGRITLLIIVAFYSLTTGCNQRQEQEKQSGIKVVTFEELTEEINLKTNKLKIVNFWATWCKPCIEEMPHFENVANANNDKVELYFISLDFPKELSKVTKFHEKKQLQGNLWLLNETNYDFFMPKIDESWTGAIPATLFVDDSGNKYFYEKSFSEKELSDLIAGLL